MIEQIREQIELLFEEAPQTRKAFEVKEEIIANAIERYADLVNEGIREEDAYKNVINSIGDVNELFKTLDEPVIDHYKHQDKMRKRSALIISISVGLYFVAGIILMGSSMFFDEDLGFILALIIAAFPTCMLIYNAYAYPSYKKKEDTVVEDFKKWNYDSRKKKALRGAISAVLWPAIVIVYLLISFLTSAWYITWMLFLVGALVETIITLIFKIKELDE